MTILTEDELTQVGGGAWFKNFFDKYVEHPVEWVLTHLDFSSSTTPSDTSDDSNTNTDPDISRVSTGGGTVARRNAL